MKSKDFPALIFLIGLSAILSFIATNLIFGNSGNRVTKVEVVDAIQGTLNYADKPYYTKEAINPTKDITVDENDNSAPLTPQ